ncbi:MAG: hypothetical protein JNG90_07080 [Planctomycetaceae bacterium]|nr:hypothetical protein [Planctomycetaceae bacterium]
MMRAPTPDRCLTLPACWPWVVRALILALAAASGGPALGQTAWELTPYRVKVVLATRDDARFTEQHRAQLADELVVRTDALIGAAWQLSCVAAPVPLRASLLNDPRTMAFAELAELTTDCDKLVLVGLTPSSGGIEAHVCEWDVETQQPGRLVVGEAPRTGLADALFRGLLDAFRPLAKIEVIDSKSARLEFRAGALAPRSPTIHWVRPGQLFTAILRTNDRDGHVKGIRPLEWTYLLVTQLEGAQALCSTYSGLRSPLSRRRRGRTEQYALALPPASGSTRVLVRSRTAPDRPLAGYDVYAYGPDSRETVHLGRTGREGAIEIEPGPQPLRLLLIQHGGALIARLPIVPGAARELVALVPDDDLRLEAEGLIIGLQENLVDLVVRRAILMAQARKRIEAGKLDDAKRSIDELRRMRTQQQFLRELEQERQRLVSDDPAIQKQIDKLFDDTVKLLGNYLLPRELESLESEWVQARSGKPSQPPATEAPTPATEPPAAASNASPSSGDAPNSGGESNSGGNP